LKSLAPQVGFEPTTLRLTAECSTVELLRSKAGRTSQYYNMPSRVVPQISEHCFTPMLEQLLEQFT
jgi:hypothetical protein